MPGGTRRIPRTVRATPISPPVISSFANEPCGQRYAPLGATVPTLPALEQPAAPKHFPFPNTPVDDDIFFECLMCFFSVNAAGLQYLHLYRSVWWLQHSYTNHALNFYLMDPYLMMFIVVILTRKLVYIVGVKFFDNVVIENGQDIARIYYRTVLFGTIGIILSVCSYHVMQNHPMINILYLGYPILVYLILFGCNISPFFEPANWTSGRTPPLHACSSNASDIRKEVENLKANFNSRMKQILFSAILNAYYAGFIPCCFAPSALHYDTFWSTQHALFIFLSGFVALSLHILSLRYCDILHRAALHLGMWEKIETGRTMLLVNNIWKEDTLWPYGALVRYGRDIWRAQGDCNSSEPGNMGFKRFHHIFKNPTCLVSTMLLLHLVIVLYQLVLLCRSTLWYNIVSLTSILFFNYYVLYKLCRDYLVSYKMYLEERNIHKKINMR